MIWDIIAVCLIIAWGLMFYFSKEYWKRVHSATWIFTLIIQIFVSQIAPITAGILLIIATITWVINIIIFLNEKKAKTQLFCSIFMCFLTIVQSIIFFTLG